MTDSKSIIIIIIGAGNMGSAIALGLKRSNFDASLIVVESNVSHWHRISNAGMCVMENIPKLDGTETLILAIPPQALRKFSETCNKIKNHCGLVISVMAGITLSELHKALSADQICRAMPNIPCVVAEGMTVLCYAQRLTEVNRALTQKLFSTIGEVSFAEESLLDSATALVGGGPAYVAYFASALLEYAVAAGFDEAIASRMVVQLLRGTTALLEEHGDSPFDICHKVMTSKGTTEQAIHFFDEQQLKAIIVNGLKHAGARAKKISEGAHTCED